MLMQALMNGDQAMMRALARQAVQRFAGMEPGRPVGGTYYLYRTLRNLDLDGMLEKLMEATREQVGGELTPLEERLEQDEYQRSHRAVQEGDRGRDPPPAGRRPRRRGDGQDAAQAAAGRRRVHARLARRDAEPEEGALPADPQARRPAGTRKRRHGRKGPLDFRNTVRHSLSYGGVPAEPKFKYPRPAKPELMVVADISGSVAAFARFTLMLVYAIQGQFSKVRSFVFIDGIDEVTDYFKATEDIQEAIHRVNTEADVVWVDGHSDYGHAFEVFWERYGKDVGPKTTVLLLGDARNNYHASQSWVVKEMRQKARHVYWLNPEPRAYWNTGDSIVGDYGTHTDGVYECRNLRQLEGFVEKLA